MEKTKLTNAILAIGDCTYPVGDVEIQMTVNLSEQGGKEKSDQGDGFETMTQAAQQFGRSAVVAGQIMVRDFAPIFPAMIASMEPLAEKYRAWQREQHLAGTVWGDTDGRWRQAGYDQALTAYRDLLVFRHGESAVGPIVQEPLPHFQLNLDQMYAGRERLFKQAPDPWRETDEACIRRWMHLPKETPVPLL